MPRSHAMEVPAAPRHAGLVSIDGRTYPLESARITAEASGGIGCSTLIQTYRNPYAEPLEVLYTLPLPADGAVIGYTMRLGERTIRGEVRSREAARAAYQKAMLEGRSAALLEQDRDDTFTQRLGSLPAGQTAEIAIELLHPLAFLIGAGEEGAQWEYRFPTVVGVRYQGAAGRVPDADRLEIDRAGSPGTLPTRVELQLTTVEGGEKVVRAVEAMPLDRDLVVRWPAASRDIGAHLVEGPGLAGDDGRYGLLTITPPRVAQTEFARDLTILLDASGSMSGTPIAWGKAVAAGLVNTLGHGDRFEIIVFSGEPRSLTGGIVGANDRSVHEALNHLTGVRADGGTEMVDAVIAALQPLRPDSQHQVVLITDGEIGFEDEVVSRILSSLPDGARLHTVGVGAAPNRTLTLRAARAGRGVESFVCGDAEVPSTVKRLIAATARPVLTDVWIASRSLKGVAPSRPRDVLAGQPLVVALELLPAGGTIEVSGRVAGQVEPWTWRIAVPPRGESTGTATTVPIGAMYGRETIADLEMSGLHSTDRVLHIALRHRIASRATSLVAIADAPTVDPTAPRRSETLAVELPAYMSAESLGLEAGDDRDFFFENRVGLTESGSGYDLHLSSVRPSTISRLLGAFSRRPSASIPTPIEGACVLAVEGDLLIIEYASPDAGFMSPVRQVEVSIDGGASETCALDFSRSTHAGPHAQGLLLRLGIRRPSGWRPGDTIELSWGDHWSITLTVGPPA